MYLISPYQITLKITQQIQTMFAMGLKVCHLRCKKADAVYFLNQISTKYHQNIVLHEYIDLQEKYDVKGVHLKSFQRKRFSFEKLLSYAKYLQNKGKTLSSSFHCLEEIENFSKIPFDYVFLGPVFDSISKQNYKAKKIGLQTFSKPFKMVALGGITFENQKKALEKGFDDVASLGSIWNENNPVKIFEKWIR